MLRVALRRILWAIPTLFGISLVVFFVTTLIPDPASAAHEAERRDPLSDPRRAQFKDLPRFLNPHPADVRSRAEADVVLIAAGGAPAESAARELVQLGGAALPYILPQLDNLGPGARARVAVALAPVAQRMGFTETGLDEPGEASRFWERFWEDRAVDFTPPAVHRAVHRLTQQETALRERDLLELDTYALSDLILAMGDVTDRHALARLTEMASHVTGRPSLAMEDATLDDARRVRADWQEWWYVHREDYVAFDGTERVIARLADTRYGKWVLRGASGRLGVSSRDGEPILDKLEARAPLTLALTGLSLLLSYALAVPLGVFTAFRRGESVDLVLAVILFALYALPTFWAAEILARIFAPSLVLTTATAGAPAFSQTSFILGVVALSVGSVAVLSRYERASMLDVLRQDYIRTARAKGVPLGRLLVVHALRNALMPVVTLAGLQLPALFGGAFVVEEVFGLPGMGYETLRAVEAHDATWLTTTLLVLSVIAMLGLIATDVAAGALDPRVRDTMLARAGGSRS